MRTMESKPDHPTIKREIKQFIIANFLPGENEESLRDDDLLLEGGIIDSAGALEFVAFLEEHFGIHILDEELFPENFASVDCVVGFIEQKKGTKRP